MAEVYIPEYTTWKKNTVRRKKQMSWKRGSVFSQRPDISPGKVVEMYKALTVPEKERWNKHFVRNGYAGFTGAWWMVFELSLILTMIYLKDTGKISLYKFKSITPKIWWDFQLNLP